MPSIRVVALLLRVAAGILLFSAESPASNAADCGGLGQEACEVCLKYDPPHQPQFGGLALPPTCKTTSYACDDPRGMVVDDKHICWARSKTVEPSAPVVLDASIEVAPIPVDLYFINPDGSMNMVTGLTGYRATIRNAGNAHFAVPDATGLGPSCDRLEAMRKTCTVGQKYCTKDATPDACTQRAGVRIADRTCADLDIRDNGNLPLGFPMFSIKEWSKLAAPSPPYVMVNTNWFEVRGERQFPYVMPCTDVFGYLVDDLNVLSEYSKKAFQRDDLTGKDGDALDAFVVTESTGKKFTYDIAIRSNAELKAMGRETRQASIQFAVAGFITARHGVPVMSGAGNKPGTSNARSAIGLSADGQTMHIVVVQGGPDGEGIDAELMARYLVERLGADTVLNLDNSGSSQFLYSASAASEPIVSAPGDFDKTNGNVLAYRPVPAVLVVSAAPRDGVCGNDGKCKLSNKAKNEPKRQVVANPLDRFTHVGQFFSNDAYLFDDALLQTRGTIEDCAQRCLDDQRCANFTYAYAGSGDRGQFCTLFPANVQKLPASGDYQFYARQ